MNKILLLLVISFLTSASLAVAHGVTYKIAENTAVAVQFGYAGGESMSYATTKVFGPESSEDLEFQNGRTDALGRFAFVPNLPGLWRVVATDNLGHRGTIEVNIDQGDQGLVLGGSSATMEQDSPWLKIVFALSILANLAFMAGYKKRRKQ